MRSLFTGLSALILASANAQTNLPGGPGQNKGMVKVSEEIFTVTTGTRTERLQTETPIKTDILDSQLLKDAAVMNLGGALELLNGARSEANCQNCGAADIQLLGLPGSYNQILVDGLPLFTGVASVYGIDQIPTVFIDRIEVVKGGGSALYGPGAVAGVINLIPKEPTEDRTILDLSYRSIDGEPVYQTDFAQFLVSEDESLKGSFYGQFLNHNEYDANNDNFTDIVERDNLTLGTYMWWNPDNSTRIRLNYQYIKEDRRGGDKLNYQEEFSQVAEAAKTDYHWATARLDHDITDDLMMSLSASVVSFERESYYGGTGDVIIDPSNDIINYGSRTVNGATATGPDSLNQQKAKALFGTSADGTGGGSYNFFGLTETTSYFLDAQFTYFLGNMGDWGKHNLVFGVQYEEEDVRDEQRNGDGEYLMTLHDDQFDNLGFFIQDEWEVNNKLEIVPGVRFDKTNTLDDWVISPRIAARYKATDEITLRGNISTGFLAPRIFDEDIHIESIGGIPRDIVNSSDLEEERSLTYALGTTFTPKSMDGRLITSLQAYYTQLEDSFDLDEGSIRVENGREKIDRVNSDGSTIFGLEWDISYNFDEHWRVNGGLAYTRARYDEEDPDRGTDKYNKTPDFSGLAQLTYSNHNLFDAYVAVKWTGTMEVDRLDSVDPSAEATESSPDFFVVDIGISKWVEVGRTDVKLRAGISNLFDEYQDDLERGFERDPGYIYGPRYPRTLYVGATIEF